MKIEWKGIRCILCLEQVPLTIEHIIPSSIGGALTCDFLCAPCNSTLGAKVDSALRNDPTIRLSADHIRRDVPALAIELDERQPFVVHGGDEPGRAFQKRGELFLQSRKAADGSLIQSSEEARRTLQTMLERSGTPRQLIAEALASFDNLPPNQKREIYPGLEVVTWETTRIERDLSRAKLANPIVAAKIAYEFIACHLGDGIYMDCEPLNAVRSALKSHDPSESGLVIERLHAKAFQPFHGLCHEVGAPHTTILIRLFGFLAFRVQFESIPVLTTKFIYTHDLAKKREEVRMHAE